MPSYVGLGSFVGFLILAVIAVAKYGIRKPSDGRPSEPVTADRLNRSEPSDATFDSGKS